MCGSMLDVGLFIYFFFFFDNIYVAHSTLAEEEKWLRMLICRYDRNCITIDCQRLEEGQSQSRTSKLKSDCGKIEKHSLLVVSLRLKEEGKKRVVPKRRLGRVW